MNKDNSLAFAAGIVGGIALGMSLSPHRRRPSLRQFVIDKSRESIDEITNLADTASSTISRQQEAVKKAFEAGRKSYLKNAG